MAPSSREFTKPQNWNDKSSTWTWSQDLHQTFQAGTEFKSKKNVELYQRLVAMLEKEEVVKNEVRKSEAEVKEILDDRMKEDAVSILTVSVYDTERNDKARIYKNDLVCLIYFHSDLKTIINLYFKGEKDCRRKITKTNFRS